MNDTAFYNVRSTPDGYRMVKWDFLFNVEAVYTILYRRRRFYCDCPASDRPTCRHRDMIPEFTRHRAVDTGKFLDYDNGEWLPALHP